MFIPGQVQVGFRNQPWCAELKDIAFGTEGGKFVIPTVKYFVDHLKTKVQKDKSLFFSGPEKFEPTAKEYARKHGLHVVRDVADPVMTAKAESEGGHTETEYWRRVSTAYAKVSSGKAYVLLPGDPEKLKRVWHKGTLWDKAEWPVLQKSHTVPELLRVNVAMEPDGGTDIKKK
jgi:hypothetical protein